MILVVLLLVIAVLSAGSMVVRTVSRIWLRHWVEQRLHGSDRVEVYLERPQRLIIAAGTGLALAVFASGVFIALRGFTVARTAQFLVIAAIVIMLLGQALPRAIARRWAPELVPVLLPPLRLIDLVSYPFSALARRVVGHHDHADDEDETREGIEDLLREGELEGVGQREEIAIITGVVEFGQKTVAEVMTPASEVFALDRALPPLELARAIASGGYSRVPIHEGPRGNVVGMVHAFDVIKAGGDQAPPLRPVAEARPATACNELLFEMLRRRIHLAVVRDDAGGLAGIVTMEDLLEELVGDIHDEHDEPATAHPVATERAAP